jgi:hypothetical protein
VGQGTIEIANGDSKPVISRLLHPPEHRCSITFEQRVDDLSCSRTQAATAAEQVVQDDGAGAGWAQTAVVCPAMNTTLLAVAEEGWFALEARGAQRP